MLSASDDRRTDCWIGLGFPEFAVCDLQLRGRKGRDSVHEHPDGAIVVDTGVGFGNELIDELSRARRVELAGLLDRLRVDLRDVVRSRCVSVSATR